LTRWGCGIAPRFIRAGIEKLFADKTRDETVARGANWPRAAALHRGGDA
jgi:hypothetical protein